MKLEKVPNIQETKNYQLLKERVEHVVTNFDWSTFYEILNTHMRKSGVKVLTKEEREQRNKKRQAIHKMLAEISDDKDLDDDYDKEEHPTIILDDTIKDIAHAKSWEGIHGTICINIKELLKFVQGARSRVQEENFPIDKNFLDFIIYKVIIHELMHIYGHIDNDLSKGSFNGLNEGITELLSFRFMLEYMTAIGQHMNKNTEKLYFSGALGIYENEKTIFTALVNILSNQDYPSLRAIFDAFYSLYFNRLPLTDEIFLGELPDDFRALWLEFLKLDTKDLAKYRIDSKELMDKISKILEEEK